MAPGTSPSRVNEPTTRLTCVSVLPIGERTGAVASGRSRRRSPHFRKGRPGDHQTGRSRIWHRGSVPVKPLHDATEVTASTPSVTPGSAKWQVGTNPSSVVCELIRCTTSCDSGRRAKTRALPLDWAPLRSRTRRRFRYECGVIGRSTPRASGGCRPDPAVRSVQEVRVCHWVRSVGA